MDRGAWWATVLGVGKSRMQLSVHMHTHTHTPMHALSLGLLFLLASTYTAYGILVPRLGD